MQRDVGERDLRVVQPADAVEQRVGTVVADRDAHGPLVLVDGRLARADARQRLHPRGRSTQILDVELQHLAAGTSSFNSSDVPLAMTRPWSITAVGSPTGRLLPGTAGEQHGGRFVLQLRMKSQISIRLLGWSPVVGSSRYRTRAADQAGGKVQAPAQAGRVGLDRAVGGVGEAERLEKLDGWRRALSCGRGYSRPHESRFSWPVRISSSDAHCPVRPILNRNWSACARRPDVDLGRPLVRQQRGQNAHGGGLAGPVRPEQAEHRASDLEVHARQRLDVAEMPHEGFGADDGISHVRVRGTGRPRHPTVRDPAHAPTAGYMLLAGLIACTHGGVGVEEEDVGATLAFLREALPADELDEQQLLALAASARTARFPAGETNTSTRVASPPATST